MIEKQYNRNKAQNFDMPVRFYDAFVRCENIAAS